MCGSSHGADRGVDAGPGSSGGVGAGPGSSGGVGAGPGPGADGVPRRVVSDRGTAGSTLSVDGGINPGPIPSADGGLVFRRIEVWGNVQGVGFRPHIVRCAAEFAITGRCWNTTAGVVIEAYGTADNLRLFLDRLVTSAPPLAHIFRVTVAPQEEPLTSSPEEEPPTSALAPSLSPNPTQSANPAAAVGDQEEPSLENPTLEHTNGGPDGGASGRAVPSIFEIVRSESAEGAATLIPPDVAMCPDCAAEFHDPTNRRYQYPFITCTNCGPRLSIITGLPYDRPLTTMADFPMCPACAAEYRDPTNRRFHAQPISCWDCGPHLWLELTQSGADQVLPPNAVDQGQTASTGCGQATGDVETPPTVQAAWNPMARGRAAVDAVVDQVHTWWDEGKIVAVKGLGGFHLMCDARQESAVARLRERKRRPAKPLAVMVPNLTEAREYVQVDEVAEELLTSPERPIVVLPMRAPVEHRSLVPSVAPCLDELGIMLPYTPLHEALVDRPVVATSGNISGEPLCFDNADARHKLANIADAFVMHDRGIAVPVEDSVWRHAPVLGDVAGGENQPESLSRPVLVRRSRGYAPLPIFLAPEQLGVGESASEPLEFGEYEPEQLGFEEREGRESPAPSPSEQHHRAPRCTLAVGGELKNTAALLEPSEAGWLVHLSGHVGDMGSLAAQRAWEFTVARLVESRHAEVGTVVCDQHPNYATTAAAERIAELGLPEVIRAAGSPSASPLGTSSPAAPSLYKVQHHVAHAWALALDRCATDPNARLQDPGIVAAVDGTGYGSDHAMWGGEIVSVGGASARLWHVPYFPIVGGDRAVRHPWRLLAGIEDAWGIDCGRLWSARTDAQAPVASDSSESPSTEAPHPGPLRPEPCGPKPDHLVSSDSTPNHRAPSDPTPNHRARSSQKPNNPARPGPKPNHAARPGQKPLHPEPSHPAPPHVAPNYPASSPAAPSRWPADAGMVIPFATELELVRRQLRAGAGVPSSSLGRVFDAAAAAVALVFPALLPGGVEQTYEAQAAVEAEQLASSWARQSPDELAQDDAARAGALSLPEIFREFVSDLLEVADRATVVSSAAEHMPESPLANDVFARAVGRLLWQFHRRVARCIAHELIAARGALLTGSATSVDGAMFTDGAISAGAVTEDGAISAGAVTEDGAISSGAVTEEGAISSGAVSADGTVPTNGTVPTDGAIRAGGPMSVGNEKDSAPVSTSHRITAEPWLGVTGGCAANSILVAQMRSDLAAAGLTLVEPRLIPPTDGGLAAGQVIAAAMQTAQEPGPGSR